MRFCRNEVVGIQTGWRVRSFGKSRKGKASGGLDGAEGVRAGFGEANMTLYVLKFASVSTARRIGGVGLGCRCFFFAIQFFQAFFQNFHLLHRLIRVPFGTHMLPEKVFKQLRHLSILFLLSLRGANEPIFRFQVNGFRLCFWIEEDKLTCRIVRRNQNSFGRRNRGTCDPMR